MKKLLLLAVAAFAIAQDGGKTIPKCKGDQCQGDHGGRYEDGPAWCQNSNMNGYKKNCDCKRTCDRHDRGSDCATYCRTKRCHCDHGCDTEPRP